MSAMLSGRVRDHAIFSLKLGEEQLCYHLVLLSLWGIFLGAFDPQKRTHKAKKKTVLWANTYLEAKDTKKYTKSPCILDLRKVFWYKQENTVME